MRQRASGVLLHPTSLPGLGGVGDLGPEAYRFIDWLEAAGQTVWQVLPLNEIGFGNSPYGAATSFAGNRLLISPELLMRDGLLADDELPVPPETEPGRVRFGDVAEWKNQILNRVWERYQRHRPGWVGEQLEDFRTAEENLHWLANWSLYAALKRRFDGSPWLDWPEPLRGRQPDALERAQHDLQEEVEREVFVQFLFFRQWRELHQRAAERGVRVLGDLPIYPALDSADVWADQTAFDLDPTGAPRAVAGVPPDYFSPTGQRWGNPLYRWDRLAADGFGWWIQRLGFALRQTDLLRLDHFRGFLAHWRVPVDAVDASSGVWVESPGEALFDAVSQALGSLPFVAEDLGVITPDVIALRRRLGFPGMRVLQFAFDEIDSAHLPHNHTADSVTYTGTHDNDTTPGWYGSLEAQVRERVRDYLGTTDERASDAMLRAAMRSVADLAVTPVQDLLGLGSEARMNTPGRASGNWGWRLEAGRLDDEIGARLRHLTELSGRLAGGADQDPTDETISQSS